MPSVSDGITDGASVHDMWASHEGEGSEMGILNYGCALGIEHAKAFELLVLARFILKCLAK